MPIDSLDKKVTTRLSRELIKAAGLVRRIPVDREARRRTEIGAVLTGFKRINAILVRGVRAGSITPAQQTRIAANLVAVGRALQRKSASRRKTRSRPKR